VTRAVVVVPCFDEEKRLPVRAFERFARGDRSVGFVLVNDGSRDRTLTLLESLVQVAPDRIHVLDLSPNRGKGEAVRRGALAALDLDPEFVGWWDADLSTPLEVIPEFCRLLDARPTRWLVTGARVQLLGRRIERSALRHYVGRAGAMAISQTLRLPIYDTQCGAKMLRETPETRELFAEPFHSRWLFDVELIARLLQVRRRAGSDSPADAIEEYPLTEWRDAPGSKLRPWDYLRSALALFGISRRYRRGS
jgi:glycosyltransferase involved in cell wall biosynthesis